MPNNNFCPLPWIHLQVEPSGVVRNCCVGMPVGNLKETSLADIWNNETVRKVRLDILAGETPPTCVMCEEREKRGQQSLRRAQPDWGIDTSSTQVDGSLLEFKLKYIDFRFNNLCNFKCMTCSPVASSSIAAESKKPVLTFAGTNKAQLLNEFRSQYQTVQKIYFAGGEPMIQADHLTVLKELIALGRAKEIDIRYSTNGSTLTFKGTFIPDLWKEFRNVAVVFSIDAFGKAAEYWRHGTKWNQVEHNIRTVEEMNLPHISAAIHSVIGWPNIISWVELLRYCRDTNLLRNIKRNTVWCVADYRKEEKFSLSRIPEFKKLQIAAILDELEHEDLTNILPQIKDILKLANFTRPIDFSDVSEKDRIRNNNFFEAFPEHEDMREYITNYSNQTT